MLRLENLSPSQSFKPRDFPILTENSGDGLKCHEQDVSGDQEGGCHGGSESPSVPSSRKPSMLSSLSSLSDLEEDVEGDSKIVDELKKSSPEPDSLDQEEEGEEEEEECNLVIATKSKNSSPDPLEEEEEDDPMVGLESKKPSLDSSDKEEDSEDGDPLIGTGLNKSSLDSFEEEGNLAAKSENSSQDENEDNPMTGLESMKPSLISSGDEEDGGTMTGITSKNLSLDSLEEEEGSNPMIVDSDLLVHLMTALEPRRSSRNAGLKTNPL